MGKGVKKCCVMLCMNSDVDHHMHTFPSYKDLASFQRFFTWIKNTGNLELLNLEPSAFYKRRFICGDHFDDSQYVDTTNKRNIKRNAVPTLKCPVPLPSLLLANYVLKHVPLYKDCVNCEVAVTDSSDNVVVTAVLPSTSDGNIGNEFSNKDSGNFQHDVVSDCINRDGAAGSGVNVVVTAVPSSSSGGNIGPKLADHSRLCQSGSLCTFTYGTRSDASTLGALNMKSPSDGLCNESINEISSNSKHDIGSVNYRECAEVCTGTQLTSTEGCCSSIQNECSAIDNQCGESIKQPRNIRKGEKKCAVPLCSNSDIKCHMYTFPEVKNDTSFKRFLAWIGNVGNKSLLDKGPSSLYKRRFVCEAHFDDFQYINPAKKQKVKGDAIPSIMNVPPLSSQDIVEYVDKQASQHKGCLDLMALSTFACQKNVNNKISGFSEHENAAKGTHDICAIDHDYTSGIQTSVENEKDGIVFMEFQCDEGNTMGQSEVCHMINQEEIAVTDEIFIENGVGTVQNQINFDKVVRLSEDENATQFISDVCAIDHDYMSGVQKSVDYENHYASEMETCADNEKSGAILMELQCDMSNMMGESEACYINNDEEIEVIPAGMITDEVVIENDIDTVQKERKQRIQKHCCVHGCSSNNLTHSMFRFPRVERKLDDDCVIDDIWLKRCLEWVKFCGNDRLLSVDAKFLNSKNFFVCSAHFKSDDFCGRNKLHKNSVPSVINAVTVPDVCIIEGVEQCEIPPFAEVAEGDIFQRFSNKLKDLKSARSKQFSSRFEKLMESFSWKTCLVCNEKYIWYPGIKRAHRSKGHCWKFSAQNNMDPGVVPEVLKDLTFIEEQLIARVHPVLSVHKLKGCQYGYKGNVINFFQDVKSFALKLPHRIEDLKSIITVRFENNKGSTCDFQVRANKVKNALVWLKEHNEYYKDIDISSENLEDLPDDSNVFDRLVSLTLPEKQSDSESEEEPDELCDEECISHVESSGVPCNEYHNQNDQVNAVLNWPEMGDKPVSENTPGFIVCAFPSLFPWGNADLKDPREREVKLHEYFKHFMSYVDERFAKHQTFRFFAFNMWQRHAALSSGNVFMKKDPKLARMNVDQLKEYLKENPSYLKKMMFMGSNIRGSKSFWKSRCGELKDMVEQIGLPTIFLTMSAADMYWPDLYKLLTGKHISDISMGERRKLLQENPLVVDMFFQYRLECFIEHVLAPKYEVTDYWYRIEYQHRGSPHVHGLFYFKDAPDIAKYNDGTDEEKKRILDYFDELVCAVNPDKGCAMPDVHPCETKCNDVDDVKTDLAQLLKNVQRHTRCSPGYCQRIDRKTKKTVCRFHFPIAIEPFSKIEIKPDDGEIEFKPERNDERLNKFNPFIIATWRANIDIAPVLSKRAILEYLAKYVSKSEIGSQTLQEISESVCSSLDSSDSAKRAIHKILMKNCVQRDISAQEVCHTLMGLKLYSAGGRNFVVVYTNSTEWIPVDINEGKGDGGVNEGSCLGKSFIQKYSERPQEMNALSMWHIAKNYNTSSWKKCKKQNIVRVFPRLVLKNNEENNEEFYRQKVLLFVPWRAESSLKAENEKWKDVYDRHKLAHVHTSEIDINVSEFNNPDSSLEDIAHQPNDECDEDWMIASRISARGEVDGVELGRREVDVKYDWQECSKKYEAFGDMNYFCNFLESEKKKDTVTAGTVCDELPQVIFSPEQAAVKNLMEAQIKDLKTNNNICSTKRVLVQGKAGTGKSLLIKFLCQTLHKEFGHDSYLLLGPTGVAAINIGGATVHSALRIPAQSKCFKDLKGESARKFCDELENVKFVILDEYSMVGCTMLGMVDKRLREGKGVNEPFGGLNVYFFGDYKQLPPVKDTPLYGGQCRSDLALDGRKAFNAFQSHFVLTKGHRQKDAKFQDLLDRVSVGEVTPADFDTLKRRFKTFVHRKEEEEFDEAIHLFATKEEVASYNLHKLYNLKDENGNLKPVARIAAKHHGKGASYGTVDQANGLPSVLYLARGCKIMLRTNLWVKRGLVNGSMGTVVDILYESGKQPPSDSPAILMCKFENYTGPGIGPDKVVPIAPVVRTWTPSGGQQCSRQQFPVVVCYGCSIHKSQGLTMDKAVIDIGKREFALGLTYVGLSRVKTLEGILLQPFPFQRLQLIKSKPEMMLRKEFGTKMFSI